MDENGVIHYGDRVPAEYSQREQSMLNSQGVEVGKTAGGDEPDRSRRVRREAAGRMRAASNTTCFLISTYPSVKEIENVRDTRLDQINGQVFAAEAYVSSLTTRVDGLKNRALMFAPYNTKPGARRMPDDLAEEMVRAMSELRTQNSALTAKKAEIRTSSTQFDADIKRFKELRTSAAARLYEANGRSSR